MKSIQLSPGDERYIYMSWRQVLACENAKIISSTWTIPETLTKLDDGIIEWNAETNEMVVSETGNATRIKVRGLVDGEAYELHNQVILDNDSRLNGFLQIDCIKLSGEPISC